METGRQTRVKRLGELLAGLDYRGPEGLETIEVCGVTDDSRKVRPGMLFVACAGMTVDGHSYINEAVARGAAAVLAAKGRVADCDVPSIEVADPRMILGSLAAVFFDFPSREMKMIGITGTNGKTTCSYLLEAMIAESGGRPGVIGTVNVRFGGRTLPAAFTTPQAADLQALLRDMADSGVDHAIMEVSSHALAQDRLQGTGFDVALFTNLSRDHLDFHGDMEDYYAAKEKLFTAHLKPEGAAVLVIDSDGGEEPGHVSWQERLAGVLRAAGRRLITCGIGRGDVRAEKYHFDLQGIEAEVTIPGSSQEMKSPLVGAFNLKNLLGVTGCGVALGLDAPVMIRGVAGLRHIPGRLERVTADNGGPEAADGEGAATVFVDYAHTPDAMENVLATLKALQPRRIIVVFGCGGDRDRGKRPLMGRVAARYGDVVLLTSDNPRSEEPESILADIEMGVKEEGLERLRRDEGGTGLARGYDIIVDRARAIGIAIRGAQSGDVVLISGKGHEDYQIIGDKRISFDDRRQAEEELRLARQAA